jgi:hypothetical protein
MKAPLFVAVAVAFAIGVGALTAVLAVHRHSVGIAQPPASPYRGSIPPPGIRAPDFTLHDYRGKRSE